jgi:hypothetical protein
MDSVESIIIHADIENTTGINLRLDMIETDFSLSVSCVTGPVEIELTSEQIDTVINTIPFNPDISIVIPSGIHQVNTDSSFVISTWFEVQTNVEHTIDFKGGEK